MKFFGPKRWSNVPGAEFVATPVGSKCFYCPRTIKAADYGVIMPFSSEAETTMESVHDSCFLKACGIGDRGKPDLEKGVRVEVIGGHPDLIGQRGTIIGPKVIPDWTCWVQPDNPHVWLYNGPDVDGFTGCCIEKAHLRKLNLLELIAEAAQ